MSPLKVITPEQFADLRAHLQASGYTEEGAGKKLGLKPGAPLELVALASRPPVKPEVRDRLDAIIHLFLLGESLSSEAVRPFFPSGVWDAMQESGLLGPEAENPARYVASVALYPIRHLYLVSDRWTNADHSPRKMFPDIVYPALTSSAKQFIDFTSYEPCDDFVELCAGTAPAALLAAGTAKRTWATDIAERSLEFARFNVALNGISNVAFAKGDLFAPLGDQKFDRIAAHPPYVPVLKPAEIFYGGGEVGEEITEGIITALPERLKPGGRLYCRALGTERPGETFEQRIRVWLGQRQAEFDVALFTVQTLEPRQFALQETLNRNGGRDEFFQWEKLFERNNVYELVIGVLVVQRHAEKRPAFTFRRAMRSGAPAAAVERILHWETEMRRASAAERLLEVRPSAIQGIQLTVQHRLAGGDIQPQKYTLTIELPFAMDCNVQPWMALLVSKCDGTKTIFELLELAKQNQWIVPETPPEEFLRLVATLIGGGFLEAATVTSPAGAG
jgi:methylase of polypeptide subunit release factors